MISDLNIPPPFCSVDCGLLPPLGNGTISYSPNTALGGVATHSCDVGFIVQGGEERVCLSSGQWEEADIFCLQGTPLHYMYMYCVQCLLATGRRCL